MLVTVAIVVITSFTIDATDTLRGSQSALSILAKNALESSCPAGMKEINLSDKSICMDIYENSANEQCPNLVLQSSEQTQTNINEADCLPTSAAEVLPWANVNFHQAKALCARAGKRLPSASEWYEAALGTRDDSCNLNGHLETTGKDEECLSARGMYDMVGNVWEWVDEEVTLGQYHDRALPEEGYVKEADNDGVATVTDTKPDSAYGSDYFWHNPDGIYSMMRGGYYGAETDGGVYAVHTKIKPSFSSAAIGFRCVMNL